MVPSRAERKVPHILIVDDDVDDRSLATLVLTKAYPDAKIDEAGSALSFGEAFERGGYDLAITANELSWTDGLTVLSALKERWPQMPVVMLAEQSDERFAVDAMKQGLDDFLVKSSKSFVALPEVVRTTLERVAARKSEARLETRLQTLLDQSSIGVFRSTLDGRLLEVNAAFLSLFAKDSLVEASDLDLKGLLVPAGETGDPVQLFDDSGRLSRQIELQLGTGEKRWVAVSEMILLDGEGDLVIDGLVQDISATKLVEKRLESELQARRGEGGGSERFAAIAAHELREPVRTIETYTQLIADEYADRLDLEAAEYLSHVLDGAQRLQKLLGDLLAFSRVEVTSQTFERVSCEEVVNEMLRELNPRIRVADAVVTVDPLPTVLGDRHQLEMLFRNLIENALKFRRDEALRIRISALQQDDDWVFSVRDNGLGIESPGEEIFALFTRLRPEIPGSGVGLAICKRVIEFHGGRLWVESEAGRGSNFRFTIPLSRARRGTAVSERSGASQRVG